ncbi:MAG: NAD(P)/FAD-dependent oxidoreductase [Gammaproteobacteria bacterium]
MRLDALIIGGGPAGATTAFLLAQAGWSVGVVEKKAFPRRKVCGEFISATSLPLLQKLGLLDFYLEHAGPEIRRIGLYVGNNLIPTAMPPATDSIIPWGHALKRDCLDTALLNQAAKIGVKIWQPFTAKQLQRNNSLFVCTIESDNQILELTARVVILASGSWERSVVSTQHPLHRPSDLLAFKAHFAQSHLPLELMPCIGFPGGYGGFVHCGNGSISLSCCIRRDMLHGVRQQYTGLTAAEAVQQHIMNTCLGSRIVLENAVQQGNWLAAGPIRPGIRHCYAEGIFYVGNLAGEAHPILAEGISMAMQAAGLLADVLIKRRNEILFGEGSKIAGKEYTQRWKNHFSLRIYMSSMFAQLLIRPRVIKPMLPLLRLFPSLLTNCAKLGGKIHSITL